MEDEKECILVIAEAKRTSGFGNEAVRSEQPTWAQI